MKMIKAIIRSEKYYEVARALEAAGYRAITRHSVLGHGKQKGLKVGDIFYDELPKESLMIVVKDEVADQVVSIIAQSSKSNSEGAHGDGKIFITPVEKVVTISSGEEIL